MECLLLGLPFSAISMFVNVWLLGTIVQVGGSDIGTGCLLSLSTSFLRQGLSLNLQLTNFWMTREPLGPSCLCSAGITGTQLLPLALHLSSGGLQLLVPARQAL